MTTEEIQEVISALMMRRNYIETGTVTLSANDVINAKKSNLVKPLDRDQKITIRRIETIIDKLQNYQ